MRILFVVPEYEGLIKVGGLSDFNRAVAHELKKLGHDVRVLMPHYRALNQLTSTPLLRGLKIPVSIWHQFDASVNLFKDGDIPVYLLENNGMYDRAGIYDEAGQAYEDNPLRFALLSQASFALSKRLNWRPDILHCCDWQSAMVPFYLREHHVGDPFFRKTKAVLTLHNGAYQGRINAAWHEDLGIHPKFMVPALFEDMGSLNLMKGGIKMAHRVATVSPDYKEELLSPQTSHGLHYILRPKAHELHGILNGVDNDAWSPLTDPAQPYPYDESDLRGKQLCKTALQKKLNLPVNHAPLFAYIGRIAEQKGFSLMIPMLKKLLLDEVQVVVIGHGEARYQTQLRELELQFRDKFRYLDEFGDQATRSVLGGSDFLLMPSLFEPCGLTQLYALRYGTIPIVHAVGGLRSTVAPLDGKKSNRGIANGYHFNTPTAQALLSVVTQAVKDHRHTPGLIEQLKINGMRKRFYWSDTTAHYLKIYQELTGIKPEPKRHKAPLTIHQYRERS